MQVAEATTSSNTAATEVELELFWRGLVLTIIFPPLSTEPSTIAGNPLWHEAD